MRGPGFSLISIVLLLLAAPARAESEGDTAALAPQPAAPPAASQGAYMPQPAATPMPVLSDIYERGNERLVLQWQYLENRIQTITALELPDEADKALTKANYETEGFCNDANTQDAKLCLKWYLEMKVAQLSDVKKAMLQNQDSIANLSTNVYTPNGQPVTNPRGAIVPAANLMPGQQIAGTLPRSIPKELDLKKQEITPSNVSAWYVDMTAAPTGGDFAKEENVSLSNTGSGSDVRYLRDANGVVQTDPKKLEQAQKRFKSGSGLYGYADGKNKLGENYNQALQGIARRADHGPKTKIKVGDVAALKQRDQNHEFEDYRRARNFTVAFTSGTLMQNGVPSTVPKAKDVQTRFSDGKKGAPDAKALSTQNTIPGKSADKSRSPGSVPIPNKPKSDNQDVVVTADQVDAEVKNQLRRQGKRADGELDYPPPQLGYTVESNVDPASIQDTIDALIPTGQQ